MHLPIAELDATFSFSIASAENEHTISLFAKGSVALSFCKKTFFDNVVSFFRHGPKELDSTTGTAVSSTFARCVVACKNICIHCSNNSYPR